jgi:hypothetical protein
MNQNENLNLVQEEVASVETPLQIDPSPLPEQAISGIRDIVIIAGALSAIMGFLSQKDLVGLIAWLQSSEAYPFIGLVMAGATLVWRHIGIRKKKAVAVTLGLAAPNSVAQVKGVSPANQG